MTHLRLLSLVAVLAFASGASAQGRCIDPADSTDNATQNRYCGAPLLTGFGGTAGYGDDMSCLRQNDDGSSAVIDITPYFPNGLRFFTALHNQVYVNTNGNISFSGPVQTFTPEPFPVANRPMIAPFWADVDIRNADGACSEMLGLTCTACTPCQPFAAQQVWWHLEEGRAVFTWDEVGYYSCQTDRRNSFQLILEEVQVCGGAFGDFNVEFRFNRCEWDTGQASGGIGGFAVQTTNSPCSADADCRATPRRPPGVCRAGHCVGIAAQSGFDAGNRTDFFEIMGSRNTREINRRLCEESNVAEPGVWRFQLREGAVLCPEAGMPCATGMVGVCEAGVTSCECAGDTCTTSCVSQVMARTEVCNTLDDDCDGMIDEETDGPLCDSFESCVTGTCVGTCFEGGCPSGFTCTAAGCVEDACVDITCGAGERCRGGVCESPCADVVCPVPLVCAEGACVDPCAEIGCDECTTCVAGACATRCDRGGSCGAGEACDLASGICIDANCVGVACTGAEYCDNGVCVDPCVAAVCPEGLICSGGECLEPIEIDAGVPPLPDAGTILIPDTGPPMIDASLLGGEPPAPPSDGCACRSSGGSSPMPLSLAALLVGLALVWRRRRSRRNSWT